MKCAEFKYHLSEYVDGELSPALRKACEGHLSICAECRKAHQALQSAWKALGDLPAVEPSSDYVGRFWTRVADREAKKNPWAGVWHVFSVRQQMGFSMLVLGALILLSAVNLYKADNGSSASVDIELIQNIELAEHFDDINEIDEWSDADLIQALDELPVEKG